MAIAFVSSKVIQSTAAAGSTITTSAYDISGTTNPVILVEIVMSSNTVTVSAVSWSLGSGTTSQVVLIRGGSGGSVTSALWVIPAPTVGSGTITVTFSASVTFAAHADTFSGADQTTPCPTGDAVTDITTTQNLTQTASNLTADDGSVICAANASSNISSITPNQTLVNNAGAIDIGCGYATGTASITSNYSSSTDAFSRVVARIVSAAAGGGGVTYPELERQTRGVHRGVVTGAFHAPLAFKRRDRIFIPSWLADEKAA